MTRREFPTPIYASVRLPPCTARFTVTSMLGVPLIEWMRFFACGFVGGFLLFLIPYGPMSIVAVFEMVAAAAGLLVVAIYARSFEPLAWRRLIVRARRYRRALARFLLPGVAAPAKVTASTYPLNPRL